MEPIIDPISVELLSSELTPQRFVRKTRKGNNEIYIVNKFNAPHVLQEIGRLRELTFRESGGGTGNSVDLDDFDLGDHAYEQLIVWSPEDKEIIGGYRFIRCDHALDTRGKINLSTAHYFTFSDRFVRDYMPYTIELGRSWVQPNYQPSVNPRKGLFALDNIWDGLGALVRLNPDIRYFFGKVTMYPSYNPAGRDFLLHFMHHYFPDNEQLMKPIHPLELSYDKAYVESQLDGLSFKDGFKVLNAVLREKGEFVPPLVNIYMSLSSTMKTFGTAINPEFGNVEETAILVTIDDIYPEKKERHVYY